MDFAPVAGPARPRVVGLILMLLLGGALPLVGGCASGKPATLTFEQADGVKTYSQQFSRAYVRQSESGEYDVLLIEDGIAPEGTVPAAGVPIHSAAVAPLKQVVHLRVLWRPQRGTKADHPSATNAVVDWYVCPNDAGHQRDYLHYQGAGFVSIYGSGDRPRIWIRSATVALKNRSGNMVDPLGRSTLSGSFLARRNDALVKTTVEQFRHDLTVTQASATPPAFEPAFDGPPPRSPPSP